MNEDLTFSNAMIAGPFLPSFPIPYVVYPVSIPHKGASKAKAFYKNNLEIWENIGFSSQKQRKSQVRRQRLSQESRNWLGL